MQKIMFQLLMNRKVEFINGDVKIKMCKPVAKKTKRKAAKKRKPRKTKTKKESTKK